MCAFLGAELLAANALWAGSSAVSVGAGLGALGAGVSAISAISQGQAQSDAAKYNAQVSENNAIAARQKASFDEQLRREQLARVQADIEDRERNSPGFGKLKKPGEMRSDVEPTTEGPEVAAEESDDDVPESDSEDEL